jgi:hypothetical protein
LRPYDVVEEPLDSGGDLAEDLGGARQRTLDVHAVVCRGHLEDVRCEVAGEVAVPERVGGAADE